MKLAAFVAGCLAGVFAAVLILDATAGESVRNPHYAATKAKWTQREQVATVAVDAKGKAEKAGNTAAAANSVPALREQVKALADEVARLADLIEKLAAER